MYHLKIWYGITSVVEEIATSVFWKPGEWWQTGYRPKVVLKHPVALRNIPTVRHLNFRFGVFCLYFLSEQRDYWSDKVESSLMS
jgi:hypothetical protein